MKNLNLNSRRFYLYLFVAFSITAFLSSCSEDEEVDLTTSIPPSHSGLVEVRTGGNDDPVYYYSGTVSLAKVDSKTVAISLSKSLDGATVQTLLFEATLKKFKNGTGLVIPDTELPQGGTIKGVQTNIGDGLNGAYYSDTKLLSFSLTTLINGKTHTEIFTTDLGENLGSPLTGVYNGTVTSSSDLGGGSVESASVRISQVNHRTVKISPVSGDDTSTFYASVRAASFASGKNGVILYVYEVHETEGGVEGILRGKKLSSSVKHHGQIINETSTTKKFTYSIEVVIPNFLTASEYFTN